MTAASLTSVYPSSLTYLGLSRQPAPGVPVLPGSYPGIPGMATTIPLDKSSYEPQDTPHWLMDTSIRGSMAQVFQLIQGPEDATFSYGGPFYGDIEGYFLDNTFGDLSTTGSSASNTATYSGTIPVGGISATLSSISGYGTGSTVQLDGGPIAEVVIVSSLSGSVISFANTPTRFSHANGSVSTVTGPYTHTFAILNSGSGQPPLLTATDYTGITAVTGARSYSDLCCSQIDITGNTEQLFEMKVSGNSWLSIPAAGGGKPVNVPSPVVPIAAWDTVIDIGGSTMTQAGEYGFSIKRELQVYWTAQGTQSPFIIGRGTLDATSTLTYSVATDETGLTRMLQNEQPPMQVTVTNGLSGTNLIQVVINAQEAGYTSAKPNRSSVLMGYDDEIQCIANSTNIGGSGGLGPLTIQLTNNVPTY
jgi:hypothetical protein